MILALLLTTTLAVSSPSGDEHDMPPPPAGMKRLDEAQKAVLIQKYARRPQPSKSRAAEHELPENSAVISEESADLEAMRALEEVSIDPVAKPDAELMQSLRRLGIAHPVRQRMLDVFEEPVLREDSAPPPLPRITNLARLDMSLLEDHYDIPVEMQPLVAEYIRFFQGPGRKWFRKWMSRSTRYLPMMHAILDQHGVPRDTVYLAMIESGFSVHAYSWAHAAGPWQFISATGLHFGLEQNFWVDERRDPVKATHAAANYLKELHGQLGHWYLAWAGYNTGGGRVRRLIQKKGTRDFWELSEGRGLMPETKHYVPKLIAAALLAKNPGAFGFREEEFDYEEPFAFEEVRLVHPTSLEALARDAGVSLQSVRDLNPELKRGCTPPSSEALPYTVRLPLGSRDRFLARYKLPVGDDRFEFRSHRVARGDTLASIARRYGAVPEAILTLNQLRKPEAIRTLTELVIPVSRTQPPAGREHAPARPPSARAKEARSKSAPSLVSASAKPTTASVTVKPTTAAVTVKPTTASVTVKPETANVKPETVTVKPETVTVKPTTATVKPTTATVKPTTATVKPTTANVTVKPETANANANAKPTTTASADLKPEPTSAKPNPPSPAIAVSPDPKKSSARARGSVLPRKNEHGSRAGARRNTHAIADGETLWRVSRRYEVSVEELMRWNGIKDHRQVRVGQVLVLDPP